MALAFPVASADQNLPSNFLFLALTFNVLGPLACILQLPISKIGQDNSERKH